MKKPKEKQPKEQSQQDGLGKPEKTDKSLIDTSIGIVNCELLNSNLIFFIHNKFH